MKYLRYTLLLLVFLDTYAIAQSFENKRMLTSSITSLNYSVNAFNSTNLMNPTLDNRIFSFRFQSQITFGKVNSRNELFAYGIDFGMTSESNIFNNVQTFDLSTFNVSPMMMIQKFVPIYDKIYLSPAVIISTGYNHLKSNQPTSSIKIKDQGINSLIALKPFSITYKLNEKTNLIISLGHIVINHLYSTRTQESISGTQIISDSLFSYRGNLSILGFGYQKVF